MKTIPVTHPIPFPGDIVGPIATKRPTVCIPYGDSVTINIEVGHCGYLSNNNDHAFLQVLPSGHFAAGSVIVSSPAVNSDLEVTLSFLDATNGTVHTCHVKIRKTCPAIPK
jgi:hypothetical protein